MLREVTAELLDEDSGTAAEIASSLADLGRINRWFGGMRTTARLLLNVADESNCHTLSLLEVGAGAGDVPLGVQRILSGKARQLDITLLDRMWSHLPPAMARSVCGDALQLPFRDGAFDVVSCTLLAHHLEPTELGMFVRESLRVCRRAVLINDLIRSRMHLCLVYAGLPLFRSRLTWHDAPASVRRAYTIGEMRSILQTVPARRIAISRHYLYRMGVLLWK
ncbi:MAG TPA: methyltransferase domain-containing protein [Candidatus Binatia bacterium]|nr:methyltransferase domain-containing protein [Candidatus Binatia bacterium]